MEKEKLIEKEEKTENKTKEFEKVEVFQEVEPTKKEIRTDSYFDGGLIELIGWKLLAFLITIVTFGIAGPWGKCMLYSYQIKHTVYNGKRLKFEGTGGDLFVNRFKWALLTIITLGIYAIFVPIKKTKWVISNIHFEDEEFVKEESFFDGKTIQLIGINLLCNIINIVTLGFLHPFTVCFKLRWINKHTVINRKKLVFNGKAISLFGKQILWNFLTIITFGIYGLWLPIKVLKWKTKNTHIKVVGETEQKDKSLLIAIPILILAIIIIVTVVPGLIKEINFDEDMFNNMSIENLFDNGIRSDDYLTSSVVSEKVIPNNQDVLTSQTTSSKNVSTNKETKKESSSSTTTATTTTSTTTTTSATTNYPTLEQIEGDYGIKITEKQFVNGLVDESLTQEASGIETFTCSGGKIQYLTYTMNYDQATGYAHCTSSKGGIEGYFTFKYGTISAELREYIYEDSGQSIKIERKITGNKM